MQQKILIIDDESNNLDVLDNCLEKAGFDVRVADSGEVALKQVAYIKPDLILLDINMPGMDGFETCQRLQQNEVTKDTPIIFLTIEDSTVNKIKGLETNAVDYITKPFQASEVISRINKHLTISKLQKQLKAKNVQLQDYIYLLESLIGLGKTTNEAHNVQQMMDNAMQLTLSVFNCDRAWLLYPCTPDAKSWQVPMRATKPEFHCSDILNTKIPMEPAMSEVMQTTLAMNEPLALGADYKYKLPSKIIEQFSVQSKLCLAIHPKIGEPWMFGLQQCSHPRVWTENELNLFHYFGQHIAVGLGFSISFEKFRQKQSSRESYHSFIGASKPMQTIYQIIDNVATSNASILITGESGTGKELCAEAIYQESKRANKPFIVCNCAAIPEKLMESSLFGHVKGAFTGADSQQEGLVSEANGGTLFLDEIGELPLTMQSTLLRFVQTKTFSKVGSCKLEQVDVRFICATNKNLLAEVKAKRFREDLYYRINTIEIKLPALRERGRDVLLLANFFMHEFAQDERKHFQSISPEAEKKLLSYKWSGNVRQLRHTMHNIVILNVGKVVTAEMINLPMNEAESLVDVLDVENNYHKEYSDILAVKKFCTFKEIEQEVIVKAVEHCDGSVTQAAQLLDIGRSTIFKKLKQYKKSG